MEEKRVPVVGDTWRCRIGDESSDWLLLSHADEEWQVARVDGPQAGAKGIMLDAYFVAGPWGDAYEFVSSAAPPKERDWRQWIPPENWRGTKQKLRAGKIIAWRMTAIGEVVLMEDADRGRVLATNSMYDGSDHTSGLWSIETVIVADVGCEPTDPSVLYGKPASPPVVEAPRVAQPKRSEYQVNTGRALMLEEGPGIALMLANPCRLVACGHRACTPKSTEPWHSNFDDADLMGRDVR